MVTFAFQRELNGNPAAKRVEQKDLEGNVIVTESHWYPDAEIIIFFTQQTGQNWCNVWIETGVAWGG